MMLENNGIIINFTRNNQILIYEMKMSLRNYWYGKNITLFTWHDQVNLFTLQVNNK